jgi:DHA3 family tetracycline resistance protein-like MFS transporter
VVERKKFMNANKMYLIIRSVMGLAFHLAFTATALYRIDIAQLQIYQLILIGSALEIAVFLFEVPTGIVADLKSRRLSVIIGFFIIGIGFVMEALTPLFIMIFIAQIVWGLGYTFISGALDSWVSDETENIEIEKTMIAGAQFNKFFSFLGIVLAGVIGMYNITLAIYVAGGLFALLGVYAILIMKEHHFHKEIHTLPLHKEYFNQLVKGFKHIKKNKVLKIMFVVMLFFGLFSEGIDRTYELYILDHLGFRQAWNIPTIWILVIINAAVAFIGLIVLQIVKKHIKEGKHVTLWAFNFTISMVVGLLIFAYFPLEYVALFGYVFFSITREGTHPLLNTILLKNTPSKIKATVLSGFGQLDAIGQLLSGVIMVGASVAFGIKGMYGIAAALLLIPIIFLPQTNLKTKDD